MTIIVLGDNVDKFPSSEEWDSLWAQGVNGDDFDRIFLLPNDIETSEDEDRGHSPCDWWIDKLLQGCCSNTWYKDIAFRGETYLMGVEYHA